MPNPTGASNTFVPESPYGSTKQMTQALREAPISGAPVSTHAINAPRRAGKNGKRQAPAEQQAQPMLPLPPPPTQGDMTAQVWAQVALTPGASLLVQQYAQMAAASGA